MNLTLRQLVFRYTFFAILATLSNLLTQRLVFTGTGGWYLAALMAGTLVGLIVKYILDKKWIFHYHTRKLGAETRTFSLYTLTGVGTTAIFWGSETLFWIVGQTQTMREAGAVLGLTIGYVIKYNLDRRFVFTQTARSLETSSQIEEQQQ